MKKTFHHSFAATQPVLNRRRGIQLSAATLGLVQAIMLAGSAQAQTNTPPSAANSGTNSTTKLPAVVVTGERDSATTGGNVVDTTVQKLPVTLHETPRSVSVIDSDRMREQGFRTPVDTFAYTPGVFANSPNSGGYHFIARGFRMAPDETRIDGFTGFYVGGGQSPQMLYGVDRIVIQRGPAGLLYGAAALPGGMINIITKKPLEYQSTRVDITTGTYLGNGLGFGDRATRGAEFDSTGPVTKDGRILYRAILAGDNSSQYTDDILNRTRFFNTSMTFKLDEEGKNTLTPVIQYAANTRPAGAGYVISPSTSLTTADGRTGPVNTADLSPLGVNLFEGGRTDNMFVTGFDFQSKPIEDLTINANYRFIGYETRINQWSPQVTTVGQRTQLLTTHTVSRTQAKSEADRQSHNFDANSFYEFEPTDWWKNLVQVGLNGRQYRSESRTATGPLGTPQSPINIYNGQAPVGVTDVSTGFGPQAVDNDFYWNTYFQNQAGFLDDLFVLTFGFGYGQQHFNDAPTRKGDVTPSVGLVYNLTKDVALYASYATSYLPADPTLQNFAGQSGVFDPQTGVSYELGVKYDLPGNKASVAAAIFRTDRDNVIVQDLSLGPLNGNGQQYFIQQGGQRADGVELSGEYRIMPNWNVIGTFAYVDASYRNGRFAKPVAKTPEFSASMFTRYEIERGALKSLAGNIGVIWQDERQGGNAGPSAAAPDPLMLPSFYRVDMGVSYRINKRMDVALNVVNVLDKVIFAEGTTGANLMVAAPRTLLLRIGYQF